MTSSHETVIAAKAKAKGSISLKFEQYHEVKV